ncbi:hypothetical protein S245_036644, partial [Arachis hypogaea]
EVLDKQQHYLPGCLTGSSTRIRVLNKTYKSIKGSSVVLTNIIIMSCELYVSLLECDAWLWIVIVLVIVLVTSDGIVLFWKKNYL